MSFGEVSAGSGASQPGWQPGPRAASSRTVKRERQDQKLHDLSEPILSRGPCCRPEARGRAGWPPGPSRKSVAGSLASVIIILDT